MVRIKNTALKNSLITTRLGQYFFDDQGYAYVPEELANELIQISGFMLVDEDGNPIGLPDNKVTLDSGVIWSSISGGYVATDSNNSYTLSGSAINLDDTGIVPTNVIIQDGKVSVASDIDTSNFHVLGVVENDTIYVGDVPYYWTDADNNADNGYELVEYIPPTPQSETKVTLPSGVVWESISGGYVAEDNGTQYTLSGSAISTTDGIVPNNVTISGGKISVAENIDVSNLHVIGVNENDTINIGDKTYYWTNNDNDTSNGLELAEYIPPTPPTRITLSSGVIWESISGGYAVEDHGTHYTLSGSAINVGSNGVVPNNITVTNGQLIFDDNIDTANLHVIGVNENDTLTLNEKTYYWTDADNNADNGYELVEYIPPTPQSETKVTLPSGEIWESIPGGYVVEKNDTKYTLSGSAISVDDTGIVPTNVILSGNTLAFDSSIDTNNLHVAGVSENDTIKIGSKTYYWTDTDGNVDNGYELAEYIPPTPQSETKVTLPSGVVWESISGGYVAENGSTKYTLSGSAINVGADGVVPTNVTLSGSLLDFDSAIDTNNIHVIGVTENDTIKIGNKTYYWTNADRNMTNGYELVEYIQPVDGIVTLPSGVIWETVSGGYIATDGNAKYTVSGSSVFVDSTGVVPINVTVQDGKVSIVNGTNLDDLHIAGVTENDTIKIGSKTYYWTDVDNNPDNGYELKLYEPGKVTLDSGVIWETIPGGYVATDQDAKFTVSGSGVIIGNNNIVPTNIEIQNQQLVISSDSDIANLHVAGVSENDTIKIGSKTYYWTDTDGNVDNGLELVEYIPPPPTRITLESGVIWESIPGGHTVEDPNAKYTVSGSAIIFEENNVVATNVTLSSGILQFDSNVDVVNVHVIGAIENDTVSVGDKTYYWANTDKNSVNGLELVEYIAPTTGTVTLESGVVWETIPGGYVALDGDKQYTVSGNSVFTDSTGIVPVNVKIENGQVSISAGTNVNNLHIKGVTENDTIKIGDTAYYWTDLDNNAENGYELKLYEPGKVTLESGVVWETIPGGYVAEDGTKHYTISGSAVIPSEDNISPTNIIIQNGTINVSSDTHLADLHVMGVNEHDTIAVGDKIYYWTDVDNNPDNGLELAEYIPPTRITLPSGVIWEITENGYVAIDGDNSYTFSGSAINVGADGVVPTNVTVLGGQISLDTNIDIANLDVIGVNENDTIKIGNQIYRWTDTDNNIENGLELTEYIPPTKITLESGVVWESILGGYIASDTTTSYTVSGSAINVGADGVVPTNITLSGGNLLFDKNINTSDLHVMGVNENDTININEKTYYWTNADGNIDNGYELVIYTPPPTKITLPSGVIWETTENGYVVEDKDTKYTLSGSAIQTGIDNVVPTNIAVNNGQISLSSDIDTSNLHVVGVTANDTIKVGNKIYYWTNTDNNIENGLELDEYIPPPLPTKITLESGVVWESIPGGYVATDGDTNYTLSGSAINVGADEVVPTNITVIDGKLSLDSSINTSDLHVLGVNENDTIEVGNNIYYWTNADGKNINGYELVIYTPPPTRITLSSGVVWESIPGGYIAENNDTKYTVSGSAVKLESNGIVPINVTLSGNQLVFDDNLDVNNIHVIGVNENDTIQVGNKIYEWIDIGDPDNGLELFEYITPETTPSFSYDFDGIAFTITGGLKEDIDENILNEQFNVSKDGLNLGEGIIDDPTKVHIQGLDSDTHVTIAGKTYILKDTDNKLGNGLELVDSNNFGWQRINEWEPAIWKHYTDNVEDCMVIGCDIQPTLENNTLTVTGKDIKAIMNSSDKSITVTGDIHGMLVANLGWDVVSGLTNSIRTDSFIMKDTTLYVPKSIISGVTEPLTYTLEGGVMTISAGTLDLNNVHIQGIAITSFIYKGKKYYINTTTGKLVPNAWQRNTN